jgi:cytochrome c peroxidase
MTCALGRQVLPTVILAVVVGLAAVPARGEQAMVKPPESAMEEMKAKYRRPAIVPFPKDPRLSSSNFISCATCHTPAFSWGDGLPKGIGHGMKEVGRRTPTILNLAWIEPLFWDGRAPDLEAQALGPIQAPGEMNQSLEATIAKLRGVEGYRRLFEIAYPGEGVTEKTLAKAIATFEGTIVSGIAPFDEWVAGKDDAISASAKRGFMLFNTRARCSACHSGWSFTDGSFHDIGVASPDRGRGKLLENVERMQHAFKTPTLRNVDHRAPYMRDGSLASLEAVVDYYNTRFVKRPSLSHEIQPLGLGQDGISDVVAFMTTLTSADAPVAVPVLPR